MKTRPPTLRFLAGCAIALVLAGCAGAPRAPDPVAIESSEGVAIVAAAESMIGQPYHYGGATPAGFDCSGLVLYAHAGAGLRVPRTAASQAAEAEPVRRDALEPGDLVFFRVSGRRIDHVGIYVGEGRFVHAPSSGRVVSHAWLEDPWYARRYAGAGRFWTDDAPAGAAAAIP